MMSADPAALHLAAIVESSDDAIFSEDLDGRITTWNRGAERHFGYTVSEISGKPARLLIPPERSQEEQTILDRVRAGRAVEHFETARLARSGRRVLVSMTVSPVRTPNGEIIGVSTIARDVTARKQLERETYRLAALVSWSDDAIVSKSLDGTILSWNRGAEQLFGYAAGEAIGRSIRMIIPADRQAEEDEVLARVRAGLAVDHFETIRQRKDGSLVEISLTVSPIKDRDGVIIGASKIARDISLQKRLVRQLEEASRQKDEFLATLSHELRTPLNALMGYARMLRSGAVPPERRDHVLGIVERNAVMLSQLVSDVLDMSSIVTGKVRLVIEPTDLRDVVQAAVDVVRPSMEAKGLELVVLGNDRPLPYRCDANRLRQVLWNLLSNAVKFTPAGGRVEVRLARDSSAVEITVSDTGIGMRAEFLPYLFQRFRQADGGIAREFGGLGLGLALVRHFVELHGGQVSAESDGPGRGAAFHVRLPIQG